MKIYFANLDVLKANDYSRRALPVALTPKIHPLVFLMAIISYFEDNAALCSGGTKNHVNVFFFIDDYWKTEPVECVEFLVSFFRYMADSKIDLFHGGNINHKRVYSLIREEQILYDKTLSVTEVQDFFLPSVSHDIFRKCLLHICSEIPELCLRLREILGDDFGCNVFSPKI